MSEAVASFAELRLNDTTRGALARMGIDTPTPIQAAALPSLLDGRDVIGQARTGSGKTLAFGIPAIELVDPRRREVQVLVLTPTRELAVQVGGVLEELGASKGVRVGLIFGGRAFGPQRELLRKGAHVVVGTPGRVLDLINQGALWLNKVRFLVLDEADEMLDRGFAPDVERIIARATPDRQTALFSATVPDWVRQTSDKHLVDPITIKVDPRPEDAAPIEHVAYDVAGGDKLGALKDLLDHRGEGSIIVFGRTKHGVKKLARQLEGAGYPVAALQGNLSQNARDKVMADFRAGTVPILLATNVAARGLDVTHITQVINMELPESSSLLTHRIGRTGRMGRHGQAITLLGGEDGAKWRQIERGLGQRIPRAPWRGAQAAITDAPTTSTLPPAAPSQDLSTPLLTEAPITGSRNRRRPRGRSGNAVLTAHANGHADGHANGHALGHANGSGTGFATGNGTARFITPIAPVRAQGRTAAEGQGDGGAAPGRGRDERRHHQVECSACGRPAEVPFRPDPTRPVYCTECFGERKASRAASTTQRSARASRPRTLAGSTFVRTERDQS